jgi:adenylate cyclase
VTIITPVLQRAYERLGPRYPQRAVVLQIQLGYLVLLLMLAILASYLEMSAGEFLRLFALGVAFIAIHNLLYARVVRRLLLPVVTWLRGERGERQAAAAWRAAAGLPLELLRRDVRRAPLAIVFWGSTIAWTLYATWELDFPIYGAAAFLIVSSVYLAYYLALSFFLVERVMRPVLGDIARHLPDDGGLETTGVPFRWRMLAALPAINVITGAAVGGPLSGGEDELANIAFAALISVAVASTISLALTLLLSESVTRPVASLSEATERVGEGDFTVRVPVVTTDETGALARAFNRMVAGLAERERIRDAFGTYVDQEVAEHILQEGTDLAGEEVEVTMMFVDIRNFTGFAERSSARDVVAALNGLFERVVPVIHEHGGHVDKVVGDGLLAVFGAPRRQEEHADQALAAALEIERAVRELSPGGLEIGIGLNSGTVVAGNVGGAGRLEFSVIGDAVNVAARVEAATRETGDVILLAENVKRLLRDGAVPLEARPGVPLKGKRESVRLYAPSDSSTPGDSEDR